mmetsp:Transcript_792/g.1320  ORF Transcript_792/g.1320 Transcript_792/m.1320 type:complete len:146 (+) Transcript_792:36-473(+)
MGDIVEEESRKGALHLGKLGSILGVLLALQGGAFYLYTGARSMTAAIPTAFGIPLLISSLLMMKYAQSSTKMVSITAHTAVMCSLLGAIGGSAMGVVGIVKGKPLTTIVDCLLLGVLCIFHVVASVQHFIKISKLKKAARMSKSD